MKAILATAYGDSSVLTLSETEPMPKPGDRQALIRIFAAGVNFFDIYQRRGMMQRPLPFIPGIEAAGIVEQVGKDVKEVRRGDRVAYNGQAGSYAEYAAVDADRLIPLPKGMPFERAAAFPLQGMTAHALIHAFRKPKKGETVLVHAAAGGVGLQLVQWAKRLGAKVIGTVSSEEKAAVALKAGAHHVIVYANLDFAAEVKRLTEGKGAHLILDGVGKETMAGDLEAVAVRGNIVLFGSASGQADAIAPGTLMAKSTTISGASLGHFTPTRKELLRRSGEVLKAVKTGWLKLRTEYIFPLSEAAKAHELLESRRSTGKIILKVVE